MKLKVQIKKYNTNGVCNGINELVLDNVGGFYTDSGSLIIQDLGGRNTMAFSPNTWLNCIAAEAIPDGAR